MKSTLALLLLGTLLAVPAAHAEPPADPPKFPPSPLTCKARYEKGAVVMTITNTSKAVVGVEQLKSPFKQSPYEHPYWFKLFNRQGERAAPAANQSSAHVRVPKHELVLINAGESIETPPALLSTWWQVPPDGFVLTIWFFAYTPDGHLILTQDAKCSLDVAKP